MKPQWSACLAACALAGACSAPPTPVHNRTDFFESMLRSPIAAELEMPKPVVADHAEPQPVEPAPRIAGDEVVALQLRGVALSEAFHLIATHAGVNLILDAGMTEVVDAEFTAVTLDDALEALLTQNGMRLVEQPAGIFFVERADGSQPAVGEFQLESIPAADVVEGLRALIGADAIVVADVTHNFIVVRGTQTAVDLARDFLANVDRLQPQVLVEMHIFEVTLDDSFNLGVDFDLEAGSSNDPLRILSSLGGGGGPFSIAFDSLDPDLNTTVSALRSYIDLELVSSPRVLAITNSDASIEVIEEIPYVDVSTVTSGTTGGIGSTVQQSVRFKEVGIKMKVRPTIQQDGTLMIEIDSELSEVADFFNDIPVLSTRNINSRFLLRDGETAVLGGLMQDRRLEKDTGIPLLMHLPLIGNLFRGDEDNIVKRELLLFITPRILDPDEGARLAPYYQQSFRDARRRMHGEDD